MKNQIIILIGLIVFTSCKTIEIQTLKLEHNKTLYLFGVIAYQELVNIDFYADSCGTWVKEDSKVDVSKYEYHFNIEKDYRVVFTNKLGHEKILYVKHGSIEEWFGRLNISFKTYNKYAYVYQKNDNEYHVRFSNTDDYIEYLGVKNK